METSLAGSSDWITHFALWRTTGTDHELLARSLRPVPGTDLQFRYNFNEITLNDAGHAAFTAEVIDPREPTAYKSGLFRFDGVTVFPIFVTGDPVPEADGATWSAAQAPVINHHGQLAFLARLDGTDRGSAIFKTTAKGLELIVREGDPIPDRAGTFPSLGYFAPAFNKAGQVAFLADERHALGMGRGLYAQDIQGYLHTIVRVGEELEVAAGDTRTVARIGFQGGSGMEDGRRVGFNDRGQLAFSVEFTDGSWGVFVTNAVAVAEPSSSLYAVVATAMIGGVARTSRRGRANRILR